MSIDRDPDGDGVSDDSGDDLGVLDGVLSLGDPELFLASAEELVE